MAAPRPPEPAGEWLPSGFPPRSFPPGGGLAQPVAPVAPRRPNRGGGRGWWLAAAAALVAALLLLVGILAAGDDDESSDVASGTSTSAGDTSVTGFEGVTTTAAAPPPSIDPVSTTATGVAPTPAPGPSRGVLEPSVSTLGLPKTDVTGGASRAPLTLRNSGNGELTFTAQSSSPGLAVAPAGGSLGPGASITLTVTLDGARIQGEGPFSGTLSFGGSGGSKTVQVQSVVGRPPEFTDNVGEVCPVPSTRCSQQIKLAPTSNPSPTPCNTPWLYSITITDQSRIQSARVIARVGTANADTPLQRGGGTDIFQSGAIPPLQPGAVLRFAIEAADEHGFVRRLPEQTIACR